MIKNWAEISKERNKREFKTIGGLNYQKLASLWVFPQKRWNLNWLIIVSKKFSCLGLVPCYYKNHSKYDSKFNKLRVRCKAKCEQFFSRNLAEVGNADPQWKTIKESSPRWGVIDNTNLNKKLCSMPRHKSSLSLLIYVAVSFGLIQSSTLPCVLNLKLGVLVNLSFGGWSCL